MQHVTVLRTQAVDELALKKDAVVIDATLGAGGHATEILTQLDATGHFIGLDVDPTSITANQALGDDFAATVELFTTNFRDIDTVLSRTGHSCVNGIVADLGWRMEQFDGSSGEPRGFSFAKDEPLLMTFGDPKTYDTTAATIVNEWDEEDIANVLFGYAEEQFSRRIAKAIVEHRAEAPLTTATELAAVVHDAVPAFYRKRRTHPATKTFQALRIAVNEEFSVLETFIEKAFAALCPQGRLAIITFHSLEDRIVKHRFAALAHDQQGTLVHKKPTVPSHAEQQDNPRARSAKLRTIEKI